MFKELSEEEKEPELFQLLRAQALLKVLLEKNLLKSNVDDGDKDKVLEDKGKKKEKNLKRQQSKYRVSHTHFHAPPTFILLQLTLLSIKYN